MSKVRKALDTAVNREYEAVLAAVLKDADTKLREATRETFGNYIRRFFERVDKPVTSVTYADWQAFVTWYTADFKARHAGRVPRKGSMNVFRSAVKWFYEQAVRIEAVPETAGAWTRRIVLDSLDDVEAEQGVKVTVTVDQYEALLRETPDMFHRLILRCLWETIRRPVEVCSIEWDNVNFDQQKIYFPRTKTGAYKWSAISKELAGDLRAFEAEQECGESSIRTKPGSHRKIAPSKYAFSVGATRHYNPGNLGRWLTNATARARIGKRLTPHCFRGSGAVYLRRVKNWSLEDIQRQGGWKDVNVLIKSYFHDEVDQRVQKMNEQPATSAGVGVSAEIIAAISKLAPEAQVIAMKNLLGVQ